MQSFNYDDNFLSASIEITEVLSQCRSSNNRSLHTLLEFELAVVTLVARFII